MAILRECDGVSPANGSLTTATRTSSAAFIGALAALALSGCAAEQPTLEQVKAETEAVLQPIADEVPGGVVEVVTP